MRRKLVYVKILEIAAIFIVFLTFYNFFPAFKTTIIESAEDLLRSEKSTYETALLSQPVTPIEQKLNSAAPAPVSGNISAGLNDLKPGLKRTDQKQTERLALEVPLVNIAEAADHNTKTPVSAPSVSSSENPVSSSLSVLNDPSELVESEDGAHFDDVSFLSTSAMNVSTKERMGLNHAVSPGMISVLPGRSNVRFGMMASADVNTLFFPEEHFYSQGRSINFSEKEIVAGGYSAGASLLFDFNKVMVETGFVYSSKTFGPDRNLFIGSSTDRHTLDFENITLNIISLPLYMHYKIDGKGLWRVYATGGASLHVIANANYDLIVETYTTSIVQNPQQLQIEREVQRVREHMRDGAKFSSKGYLTLIGGLGLERYLNQRMSVFVQPMYHYQIPFFGLIDQNGKHLQNGSLMLGTRISL
jgi:hypothetical protein